MILLMWSGWKRHDRVAMRKLYRSRHDGGADLKGGKGTIMDNDTCRGAGHLPLIARKLKGVYPGAI